VPRCSLARRIALPLALALAGGPTHASGEPDARRGVKPGKRGTGFGIGASVGDAMGLSVK
jgi:hypothetical protein